MEKEVKNVKEEIKVEKEIVEEKEIETKEKLYVKRETFISNDGREFYNYFLEGIIRGREKKVHFSPKDRGGYDVLDLVFYDKDNAELIITEESMTDSTTGKRTKYMQYKVRNIDETGTYECGIKPAQDSDKSLLVMILNQIGGVR